MIRYAFFTIFPARGFVQDWSTGLPKTYARRPSVQQRLRCDPYGIARVVRVRVYAAGERADDNGMPTYEVIP